MAPNHSKIIRQATLNKLADITTIERGTLTEEYRERPAPDGKGTVRCGPYFKHQCWENGKNRSARIPSGQVARVREHIENGHRFDELTATLEQLAIEEGRRQRAALTDTSRAPILTEHGRIPYAAPRAMPMPNLRIIR